MDNTEIKSSIFKAYDIRGLSPGEITEEIAFRVGQALVEETGAKTVAVGRDMRATSLSLEAAVVAGVKSRGVKAVRIGLTTTPMFYFATANYPEHDAGIMVTASHNPAEYNGFKLVRADALPIGQGSGMEQIRDRVLNGRLPEAEGGSEGEQDVLADYVAMLQKLVPPEALAKMRLAIDAGNGMAGHTLPALLAAYPNFETERLYFELDGTFPNHEANPIKLETLKDLEAKVIETKAAFGVAFDGDGDRVGFVDETGRVVEAHYVLALIAPELLKEKPGSTVLYDVRCSKVVAEAVEAAGGRALMTRVGHAFIKKILRETGAVVGGELSSHFYFQDFFGVECSDLVFLLLAKIISETGRPLSELAAPLRRYSHSGEINFKVEDKAAAIRAVEDRFARAARSVWRDDGVRLDFEDWWLSLRASNTEPLLRLVVEAHTPELMAEKRDEIAGMLANLDKNPFS